MLFCLHRKEGQGRFTIAIYLSNPCPDASFGRIPEEVLGRPAGMRSREEVPIVQELFAGTSAPAPSSD